MVALGLTLKQSKMLRFIGEHFARYGVTPSYAEIQAGLGLSSSSKSTVFQGLRRLTERGYITKIYGAARSVALTDAAHKYLKEHSAPQTPDASAPPLGKPSLQAGGGARFNSKGQGA